MALQQRTLRSAIRAWGNGGIASGIARRFYAAQGSKEVDPNLSEEFKSMWRKVAPNMEYPRTPSGFMSPRPPVPPTIPAKLTVNFVLPYEVTLDAAQVDMVILPATAGMMGVLPGHVPTIAELKPGILSVHEGGQVKSSYFLSSGFAFIHSNSITDIVAVEAAPLERFDSDEVKKALADAQQKLNSATTDLDKAQAQISVDVFSALAFALGVQ